MKVKYVCPECGSEYVAVDAWAWWHEDKQEFVLNEVFDAAICQDCEAQFSIADARQEEA